MNFFFFAKRLSETRFNIFSNLFLFFIYIFQCYIYHYLEQYFLTLTYINININIVPKYLVLLLVSDVDVFQFIKCFGHFRQFSLRLIKLLRKLKNMLFKVQTRIHLKSESSLFENSYLIPFIQNHLYYNKFIYYFLNNYNFFRKYPKYFFMLKKTTQ